ncbi:MAG: CerR family C-terminal domain-containing protein [Paracoccaceae bacterium]
MPESPALPPSDTRDKLIAAGLRLFGRHGFEGTSTRALATEAGVNIAAIAYHFGGKDGLRRACADHVAAHVGRAFSAAEDAPLPETPEAAMAEMEAAIAGFAGMLFGPPGGAEFVPFVLREVTDAGAAADLLFSHLFEPRHRRVCRLWSVATGRPAEAEEVRLAVFTIIGQLLYFRIAQPFVLRRMGWDSIGRDETRALIATVTENLRAAIQRSRT